MGEEQNNDIDRFLDKAADVQITSNDDVLEVFREMTKMNMELASKNNYWKEKRETLPPFVFPDVSKDDTEAYQKALEEVYFALVGDEYGCVEYKGEILYYDDTPTVSGYSLKTHEASYSTAASLHCENFSLWMQWDYSSEEERQELIHHENPSTVKEMTERVQEMLDMIDSGNFRKLKRKLYTFDFKEQPSGKWKYGEDHEADNFGRIDLDIETDAFRKTKGLKMSEEGFQAISDAIRLVVQYCRAIKKEGLYALDTILFHWKSVESPVINFINRSCENFLNGIELLSLADNMVITYYRDDPKGWIAVAYSVAFQGIYLMSLGAEPDLLEKRLPSMLKPLSRDQFPTERLEKMLAEDNIKGRKEAEER